LIYNKSLDEYIKHLCAIFGVLREAPLFANLEKCTFCNDRVAFLGYVVTPHRIEVDEAKIEGIKSWPIPASLTQLQSFLILVEFYRCFMRDFSSIAAPLNDLMKKGVAGVLYPRYRGSPVTAPKSGYDRFPPAANGWETKHPVPDAVPPLLTKEEGPPN
jgi:hypothetical protein